MDTDDPLMVAQQVEGNKSFLYLNQTMNYDLYYNANDPWRYVQLWRGAQQQPLEMAIPLTVVNVLIFASGFVGNFFVCIVIVRHRSLHTATNYYLFNLAISDLTLLVFGLPNDVAIYWHQYPWKLGVTICKIRAFMSEMASYVSVLTVVAFSTERYLAICHPLYLHTMSGLQRAIRIIVVMWLISLCCAMPFCYYTSVDYLYYPPNSTNVLKESAFCGMLSQPDGIPLAEISTFAFFVIPMFAIAVQYTKMGLEINKATKRRLGKGLKGSVHRDSRKSQANKSVIKMLSAVVIGFFICWAPFHTQRLLVIYGQEMEYFNEINTWMFFITGILYYFSSTLNPILYNVMSDKMRNAFKEVICGIKPKKPMSRHSTFRETAYSRSCLTQQNSPNHPAETTHLETIIDDVDEDKLNLVDKEIISPPGARNGNNRAYHVQNNSYRSYNSSETII